MRPRPAAVAALRVRRAGRVNPGRGQHVDMALYGCMISTQDCAVQRFTLNGGINLPLRYSDRSPAPRSPAPRLGRDNGGLAAGLGYSDGKDAALARDGAVHAEAAR